MDDPFLERLRRALAPEFQVERELASGGMGTVYLGREVALDRRVAIKVLRPELATARAVERFLREARTLAGFHHPHIVAVHRVIDTDGISCYTMDYLEGQTLAGRLSRGPLPAAEVVRLGRDLLDALAAVHHRGVVHRDIKPSNIFLEEHGAVLADFGIAKSLTEDRPTLTAPGQPPGTLLYMPPEQAAGREVTPATDLYALAMVLYESVTGRPWSIMDRVEAADWSGMPRPLAATLRRALAWAPEDRWPDAAAFHRALWARRLSPTRLSIGVAVLVLAVVVLARLFRGPAGSVVAGPVTPDLAIESFDLAGQGDPALGGDLASVTWMNLEPFGRISLVPLERSLSAGATHRPGSAYRAAGTVSQVGESLVVRLVVQDSLGVLRGGDQVAGSIRRKWELGGAIAFKLVEVLRPELVQYYGRVPPPTRNVKALDELLNGQEAFREDRWRDAELHLAQAVELDTNFTLARWRLWNVQLWRRIPRTVDLGWLLSHGGQLADVDRRLIEAELAAPGEARLEKYEDALSRHPDDDYAMLLYASELYHRGPLSGVGIESSTAILAGLTAKPVTFAPAHDQLVWALIRLGDRDAARRALDRLEATAKPGRDIDPAELEVAWQARFGPPVPLPAGDQIAPRLLAGLLDRARLGLAFDVPETELRVGTLLAASPLSAARRADGHEAIGLALVALGRPTAAVAHFDSAALLLGSSRAALQAAQWRVIPATLGFPGVPAGEVERGRRALEALAGMAGSPVAGNAAWTLALDALARNDAAAAGRWHSQVRQPRLDLLLRGLEAARAGDAREALRLTAPLDDYEDWRRLGDAFDRAVLHFARARWQDTVGQGRAADTTLLWQENSDFDGWLNGEVQAAEVDWALGLHARLRLGVDAVEQGDVGRGCPRLLRVLAVWSGAEASYQSLLRTPRRVAAARCPA